MCTRIIYTYNLKLNDIVSFSLPREAKVLHAGDGGSQRFARLWVEQIKGLTPVKRDFLTIGTGIPFDEILTPEQARLDLVFVNTFFTDQFVFHVYELRSKSWPSLRQKSTRDLITHERRGA